MWGTCDGVRVHRDQRQDGVISRDGGRHTQARTHGTIIHIQAGTAMRAACARAELPLARPTAVC